MRKSLIILMSLVLVMLPGVALSDLNLVTNGDFETGNFSGWTQSGNTGFTDVQNFSVHSGTYAAEFGSVGSLGFISQNLTTVPGGTYDLTFWLNNRSSGTPNEYQVYWDGVKRIDITNSAIFPYTLYSYNFTATLSSTELKFGFQHDPVWFDLDDVSVTGTAVPEPATLLLLGSGLIGLAGLARRRFYKK